MKRIILLTIVVFALIQLSNSVMACTTGTYLAPCIQIYLSNGDNIGCTLGVTCATIGVTTSTSFDPNPTETTPCTGCELQIEDCNGSLEQCNDGLSTTPDWNQINATATFENDITCASNCDRAGVVEDTVFNARITALSTGYGAGSRWFRACWYDNGAIVNCAENYVRIHWYPDTGVSIIGTSDCLPSETGNTVINNRTGSLSCYYRNSGNPYTQTPLIYWLNGNLLLTNSTFIFDAVSLDYNFLSALVGKIRLDTTSKVFIWSNTVPAWTDINVSGIDRNIIFLERKSFIT